MPLKSKDVIYIAKREKLFWGYGAIEVTERYFWSCTEAAKCQVSALDWGHLFLRIRWGEGHVLVKLENTKGLILLPICISLPDCGHFRRCVKQILYRSGRYVHMKAIKYEIQRRKDHRIEKESLKFSWIFMRSLVETICFFALCCTELEN